MALQDKALGLALLLLLQKLHSFRHWPLFLLDQKLDRACREMKDENTPAGRQLWYAGAVLQKHILVKRLAKG
jgi:hypothetical protein